DGYGTEPFHNAGVLQKSAGTGTTTIYTYLDNSGTVHAMSGTIQCTGGNNLGGSFRADASGAIYLGGAVTVSNTPNFQGPGPVLITGSVILNQFTGSLTLNGGNTVAGTIATNGTLNI